MTLSHSARRVWVLGSLAALVLAATSLTFAQPGVNRFPVLEPRSEYVAKEVESASLGQALNDLGKDHWIVFQVVPVWVMKKDNEETLLVPRTYQILARRFRREK